MNAAKLSKVEHREFEIQFEDVGFTTSDLSGRVLSESEAAGFTETATKEKTLPAGVVAIVGGYITDDDGQGDKIGKKVFLCIKLRVLAVDEDAAEAFTPPRALLATLADMMVRDGEGNIDLDLEGNWEVSEGSAELVGSVHDDVDSKEPESAADKAYRVHLYAVVRVPVEVPSASSQLNAIEKAEASVDLCREFTRGEYADEVVGALVDEVGDSDEYLNSRNYVPTTQFDAGTECWKVESQRTEAQRHADCDGAKLFFIELLASVETLDGIADEHGIRTLTDLMYLQQAILNGEAIEVWPGETAVAKVLQTLPSADRWLKYTDLSDEWKQHCERADNPSPRV